ncbi:mannosyl-oligosaccharide alpha-1,2-mannosidase [Blastocladiella emersonii ATCC 22665]|nr:mannosyl-oligosaccharide alpha-1,2-mannosidase [Blastocladiella emersonii ATCC 22665]
MRNNFQHAAARRARMESREQANRKREFAREDLVSTLKQDKVLYDTFTNDERLEINRRNREYRKFDEEQALIDELQRQQAETEQRLAAKQRNEETLRQIQEQHEELVRQEKIRQSIRESSVELRELEQKLHYAYMNAERAKQIEHRHLARGQEQQTEHEYAEQVARQLEAAAAAEKAAEETAWRQSRAYKASLQQQLADREDRKREDMEQFLREKAVVDELIQRIHAEDAAEQQRRLAQQRTTRAFIDEYLDDRAKWLAQERSKIEAENARIAEYVAQQDARAAERQEQKRAVDEARSRVYATLAQNIGRKESERQEIEDLRVELAEAEQREREQENDRREMQRRIQQRLDLIDAYKRQIAEKRIRREQEREEEEVFCQRMLAKLAADVRFEQFTREKKRLMQLEHKRAVDAMVEDRRRQLEAERQMDEDERRKEQELEAFKQRVIEHERQRLLRDHAAKLLGYLPKGVFKDEKDLDLFDEEFKRKFKQLQ